MHACERHPRATGDIMDAMRIVVVEDERDLRDFLVRGLEAEGYSVDAAADGQSGLHAALDDGVDCVVLDLMLPTLSGEEVLRRVRAARPSLPIIVLTARDGLHDRVSNLDAGADDYMVKPFSIAELTARIRARLRGPSQNSANVLAVGSVQLDLHAHRATSPLGEVRLTRREFGLLETFMRHPGQVLSQHQLLDRVWSQQFETVSSNVVEVGVRSLRRKLGESTIETVRGSGYRFVG
jgi:DNA-binding response OmpR family regulator